MSGPLFEITNLREIYSDYYISVKVWNGKKWGGTDQPVIRVAVYPLPEEQLNSYINFPPFLEVKDITINLGK